MKFNSIYFIIAILLFITEVLIAKYTTGFVRHTFGDYLCVILLYAFIKSFVNLSNLKTASIVLGIAFALEFLQLTDLQNYYPDEYSNTLKLILGTSFSIGDLVAYTLGILTTLLIDNNLKKHYEKTF